MNKKLIVFATYWNEIEWIKASLAQIDLINPDEIIICDGCFDPRFENRSTDGTREIIEGFVSERSNAQMISAIRLNKVKHIRNWFKVLPHEKSRMFSLPKLLTSRLYIQRNVYRLNQAATFNRMVELCKSFKPGNWFMTYDCDQFYSDEMISSFRKHMEIDIANILVGKELTFFDDFHRFSDSYEKRDYNNMPHKIYCDTRFIPTRHPSRIVNNIYKNCSDFETKKEDVGNMHHYHIKSLERLKNGYALGDRKAPTAVRTTTKKFDGKHPSIIDKFFLTKK